ncbi:hypothetical protein PR048_027867 [Dryococelus australis]|uniref:Uncharacterized protein n=1 Tax=Dryococelus australis TaxID=614101 RepID=A0ABQ9GHN9_9NEOP|nr:hypothetical protein PR048_027867 [Dryococelus australis]
MYQPGVGQAGGGMAHQMHNQYPDNADYEKGQKGDLQLEEGEEEVASLSPSRLTNQAPNSLPFVKLDSYLR